MKTLTPKQIKGDEREWYIIDATGLTLGRLSTVIATTLRGKKKIAFAPHVDNGDYVVVTNCDKFKVTGKKTTDKMYYRHTGYLGGLKATPLDKLLVKKPAEPLKLAVSGMLPKNKLRQNMISRLKLFSGDEHSFGAQQPKKLKI